MTFCVPSDVGLGRLERVVLPGLDVLERRTVEDDVDALARPQHAVAIADVADEEADARSGDPVALVELLRLVSPEDTHHVGPVRDEVIDQARSDGP